MERERESFEDRFEKECQKINTLNLPELEDYRSDLFDWQSRVNKELKEIGIKQSRKNFLLGIRKKVIEPLVRLTRERKKLFNKAINNSGSDKFLRNFYREAANTLPLYTFQRICGRALSKRDSDDHSLSEVRKLLGEKP